jgi:hypothetical protein
VRGFDKTHPIRSCIFRNILERIFSDTIASRELHFKLARFVENHQGPSHRKTAQSDKQTTKKTVNYHYFSFALE